jgi:hypothetical protein
MWCVDEDESNSIQFDSIHIHIYEVRQHVYFDDCFCSTTITAIWNVTIANDTVRPRA